MIRTVTAMTGMDADDVDLLRRRLARVRREVEANPGPATAVQTAGLFPQMAFGGVAVVARDASVSIQASARDGAGTVSLAMPTPAWWNVGRRRDESRDLDAPPIPDAADALRLVDLWDEAVRGPAAWLGPNGMHAAGTGLSEMEAEVAAAISAGGIPLPRPGRRIEIGCRLHYDVASAARTQRDAGSVGEKPVLSARAAATVLDRHRACRLSIVSAGSYCMGAAHRHAAFLRPMDAMEALRVLRGLDLPASDRIVLAAARALGARGA